MLQHKATKNCEAGEEGKATITCLTFTGHRRKRRYLCRLDDFELWLPGGLYGALADLAYAAMQTDTGASEVSSVVAFRLRRAIHDVCRIDGEQVVESCGSSEYRLAIELAYVHVDDSFFELKRIQLLPVDYFDEFAMLREPRKT